MRHTRRQVGAALQAFGATAEQAEAFTGKPIVRKTRATAREQPVVNAVLVYLRTHGIFAFRVNTQGVPLHDGSGGYRPAPTTGISDILGVLPDGRFLAVECKRPHGGTVSTAQSVFLGRIRGSGGLALVARSVEEVVTALTEAGYG